MDKPAMKAGVVESPAKAADDMLGLVEGEVKSAARAMPADKYDFSPASLNIPGAKYDGVRTFAAQVKHIAQANYFFGTTMSGLKPGVDVKAIGDLKSKDEIVSALDASFDFLRKANGTLTAANSMETLDFEGITATKGGVAAFFGRPQLRSLRARWSSICA